MTDQPEAPRASRQRASLRSEKLPAARDALEQAAARMATARAEIEAAEMALDAAIAATLAAGATWTEVQKLAGLPHRSVQRALYRVDGRALQSEIVEARTPARLLKHPDFQWLHNPAPVDKETAAARLIAAAGPDSTEEIGQVYMRLIERFGSSVPRPSARTDQT